MRLSVLGGIALVFSMIFVAASFGRVATFKDLIKEQRIIKVYVADAINSTGDSKLPAATMKPLLEDAFKQRRSNTFEIVNAKDAADIIVTTDIVEYVWMEHDPVDMVAGIGPAAMDAMKDERYVRVHARIVITDAKTGRELWADKIKGTITKMVMTQDESYNLILPQVVKSCMRELFKRATIS